MLGVGETLAGLLQAKGMDGTSLLLGRDRPIQCGGQDGTQRVLVSRGQRACEGITSGFPGSLCPSTGTVSACHGPCQTESTLKIGLPLPHLCMADVPLGQSIQLQCNAKDA